MSDEEHDDEAAVQIDHDPVNEMIVIAACLVDEDIRNRYVLQEPSSRFIDGDNKLIWESMKAILRRKRGFDLQQLHQKVSSKIKLSYLQGLVDSYPSPPVSMSVHMSALHWDSTRAHAVDDAIPPFLRALKDGTQKPAQVQALAQRVVQALSSTADQSFMSDGALLATQQRIAIEKRADISSYEYGIPALDFFPDGKYRCIPGAAPGKITNITGVSGSGKSVLAAYIALQQIRSGGARRVLYGAWEMGAGDTIEMMANMSIQLEGIEGMTGSRYATSTGAVELAAMDDFEDRMAKIAEWIRFFDPPFHNEPGREFTNDEALVELNRMVVDSGCEVVVYDLFERCLPDGRPGPERHALFDLQTLHKVTVTHGIIVSQQKLKEVENRPDQRPTRSTILGSQAWVDISDTIIGVHRPALWKAIPDDTIELLILKQRFGKWPLAIQFEWDGDKMTIANGTDVDFEHPKGKSDVF